MKILATAICALSLSACTFHIHVHEAPRLALPAEPAQARMAQPGDSLTGVVVDAQGHPMRARIAAVGESGSFSTSTDDEGRFDLASPGFAVSVLHASTPQGTCAVQSIPASGHAAKLVLQPGSTLVLQFEGASNVRCAIFSGALRVEDFTLRPGKSATAIVPAGGLSVRVYEGQHVLEERKLELAAGATQTLVLSGDA
ncbi:MAG: hypothetical protein IPJ19_18650 [Planctomycetes bacterium]|nr:hypothetical protein [Planctomycetota bacterium]